MLVLVLVLVLVLILALLLSGTSAPCLTLARPRSGIAVYWIAACGHGATVRWPTAAGLAGIHRVPVGDVIRTCLGLPEVRGPGRNAVPTRSTGAGPSIGTGARTVGAGVRILAIVERKSVHS